MAQRNSSGRVVGRTWVGRGAAAALLAALGLALTVAASAAPAQPQSAADAAQDGPEPTKPPAKPDLPSTGNRSLDLLLEMQPGPPARAGSDAARSVAVPVSNGITLDGSAAPTTSLREGLLGEAAKFADEHRQDNPEEVTEQRWVGLHDAAQGGDRSPGASRQGDGFDPDGSERWLIPKSTLLYLRENRGWLIAWGIAAWAVVGLTTALVRRWAARRRLARGPRSASSERRHSGRREGHRHRGPHLHHHHHRRHSAPGDAKGRRRAR